MTKSLGPCSACHRAAEFRLYDRVYCARHDPTLRGGVVSRAEYLEEELEELRGVVRELCRLVEDARDDSHEDDYGRRVVSPPTWKALIEWVRNDA